MPVVGVVFQDNPYQVVAVPITFEMYVDDEIIKMNQVEGLVNTVVDDDLTFYNVYPYKELVTARIEEHEEVFLVQMAVVLVVNSIAYIVSV